MKIRTTVKLAVVAAGAGAAAVYFSDPDRGRTRRRRLAERAAQLEATAKGRVGAASPSPADVAP